MIRFWFAWMALTIAGLVVGFPGSFAAIDAMIGPEGPEAVSIPFEVAFSAIVGITGTLIGSLQWLLIRRRAAHTAGWIPATGLGLLVALLVLVHLPVGTTFPGALLWAAVHALIVGLAVGLLQWRAIRHIDPTRQWLWASIAVWLAAGIIGDTMSHVIGDDGIGSMLIFLLWAALTAPILYRLLDPARFSKTHPSGSGTTSVNTPQGVLMTAGKDERPRPSEKS